MDTASPWFTYLIKKRRLSRPVIEEAGLTEELHRLKIPVFDADGKELFAKLRRPEHSTTGPKYTYQKGAAAALYGISFSDLGGPIYYMEGELEVLAARTMGLMAVSGTGGAMTFKKEWLTYFPNREKIICFDNDETGMKGALKLALLIEKGRFAWVPPAYGKDVSDLMMSVGPAKAKQILEHSQVPFDISHNTRRELKTRRSELGNQAKQTDECLGRHFLFGLAKSLQPLTKPPVRRKNMSTSELPVDRAREYPIENLLEFRQRKTRCLWHNEKTPSLHLFKDNRLFCYGACSRSYDAIDVYQKLHNVDFKEAVRALSNL